MVTPDRLVRTFGADPSRACARGLSSTPRAHAPRAMDATMTPSRPEPAEDEPDVPLRERMARLHDDLARHRDLLDVVAPGAPRAHAPVTVSEAIELADAIASAKAKENAVSYTHLTLPTILLV